MSITINRVINKIIHFLFDKWGFEWITASNGCIKAFQFVGSAPNIFISILGNLTLPAWKLEIISRIVCTYLINNRSSFLFKYEFVQLF